MNNVVLNFVLFRTCSKSERLYFRTILHSIVLVVLVVVVLLVIVVIVVVVVLDVVVVIVVVVVVVVLIFVVVVVVVQPFCISTPLSLCFVGCVCCYLSA